MGGRNMTPSKIPKPSCAKAICKTGKPPKMIMLIKPSPTSMHSMHVAVELPVHRCSRPLSALRGHPPMYGVDVRSTLAEYRTGTKLSHLFTTVLMEGCRGVPRTAGPVAATCDLSFHRTIARSAFPDGQAACPSCWSATSRGTAFGIPGTGWMGWRKPGWLALSESSCMLTSMSHKLIDGTCVPLHPRLADLRSGMHARLFTAQELKAFEGDLETSQT
jgi:hypothetical protein